MGKFRQSEDGELGAEAGGLQRLYERDAEFGTVGEPTNQTDAHRVPNHAAE